MITWCDCDAFRAQVSDLKKKQVASRKEYFDLLMVSDEEVILLRQELLALRGALRDTETECEKVKVALEKEVSACAGLV